MAPPSIGDVALRTAQTLRAFGQRVPAAGGLLAHSLEDAVRGRTILITGASQGIGEATAAQIGAAGGTVLLVARTQEKLEAVAKTVREHGGTAHVHPADLSEVDDIDRLTAEVLEQHGHVDILVNNAGRSIRRSAKRSVGRFHDYERTMQLNYFAPVKLVLGLLPTMRERRSGHIINVSSMGLQTNTPRFSAYLASKAALDAFSRSVASELIGDGIHFTTVYMPLVRTPMIAPTKIYDRFPSLSPEEAAELISEAIRKRPKRVATALGNLGQLTYAVAPGAQDLLANRAYKLFPEGGGATKPDEADKQTAEQHAFTRATRGVHW